MSACTMTSLTFPTQTSPMAASPQPRVTSTCHDRQSRAITQSIAGCCFWTAAMMQYTNSGSGLRCTLGRRSASARLAASSSRRLAPTRVFGASRSPIRNNPGLAVFGPESVTQSQACLPSCLRAFVLLRTSHTKAGRWLGVTRSRDSYSETLDERLVKVDGVLIGY